MLKKEDNEALLLYASDRKDIIGKEYKNGDVISFSKDVAVSDHHVIHFGMHMVRSEGHVTTRAFDYAKENELLEDYFKLIAIVAKSAVKLGYKKIKKDMFVDVDIYFPDSDTPIRLNPSVYDFDEQEFLLRKINKELHRHPRAKEMYITIKKLFLLTEDDESSFIGEHLRIGELLSEYTFLPIHYEEN